MFRRITSCRPCPGSWASEEQDFCSDLFHGIQKRRKETKQHSANDSYEQKFLNAFIFTKNMTGNNNNTSLQGMIDKISQSGKKGLKPTKYMALLVSDSTATDTNSEKY